MKDTTRTFRATYTITLDGAVLSTHSHILTITGRTWNTIEATLDGQPITPQEAEQITRLAVALGKFEKISETTSTPDPIGNAVAHRLHLDLARLGYGRGFTVASEVLGRTVASLAALSAEDACEVLSYACGCPGLPTQGLAA